MPADSAIADGGMLVMGHIGLTPQSSGQQGGFKAQGRTAEAAKEVIEDAVAIEAAGAPFRCWWKPCRLKSAGLSAND
jgi:3-methyl-2-oxobutanoate hydroxymethyltransferase